MTDDGHGWILVAVDLFADACGNRTIGDIYRDADRTLVRLVPDDYVPSGTRTRTLQVRWRLDAVDPAEQTRGWCRQCDDWRYAAVVAVAEAARDGSRGRPATARAMRSATR